MAKKPTAAPALNLAALAVIVAAGENGTYAPEHEISLLADSGLVEVNPEVTNAEGHVAVRATAAGIAKNAAGIAKNAENQPAAPLAVKSKFSIGTVPDVILEAAVNKKRVARGAGEKYPFDSLDMTNNRGFFVPATEKMPEPAKSLASTVSSAIARYTVEAKDETGSVIMETVTVKDYQLGEDGKRVKDADGHWIVTGERKERRAKTEATRQFRLVPVDADIEKGTPAGVWIVRTA